MPAALASHVDRRALAVARARVDEELVILLEGPRSVGKSTMLRDLAASLGAEVLDLDDLATRDAVTRDPALFMAGPSPVCVDEYQKAPLVLDAIKAELNRSGRPGRFVLAGSTRFDALPEAAQSLTGRLHRLTVRPLSQCELDGGGHSPVAQLFEDPAGAVGSAPSTTPREEYVERVVAGGFPMALARRTPAARARWFDDYVRLTLERDVRELSKVRQAAALPRLLERLAGQTGQVLTTASAAADVGLDERTADGYLRLLEAVFLVHRLPAWARTTTSRARQRPKLHVVDSGVAARLLRLGPDKLAARTPAALQQFGHLLETFVVQELLTQASWTDDLTGAGHWRTKDGDEVDLVLERDDGAVIAFEVKAGSRVPGDELKGLRKLRDAVGEPFLAGIALYLGQRSYTYEDRLHVLPVDRLWRG
ncbi:ATP-binding protein [Kineococcus glutinatus]|uniref:ATP-binding protein n=1 Tax=Kineococcus glutinatus TaxID=1070872 RepID=A0ABP9H5W4_9ACTN